MRTPPAGDRMKPALIAIVLTSVGVSAALATSAHPADQASFESVTADLVSSDKSVRLRAVQLLRDAAYPEAAIPLAPLVNDAVDEVQYAAIAAELNIFLVDKILARKRVGLVVEVRNRIEAEPSFSQGPLAIGARPVPSAVLKALRSAARDDNPRVGVEALYAFGVLAVEPSGERRRALLRESAPDLVSMVAVPTRQFKYAALRVAGRLFERRPADEPVDPTLGDVIVRTLNDNDRPIRLMAMQALGAMRYERAASALADQFRYFKKGDLAETAIAALARIGNASTSSLFVAQLSSSNPAVRSAAIEGLARIGDRAPREAIEMALAGNPNERVALAGTFAFIRLGDSPIDQLIEALRKPQIGAQAREYLIELAPGRAALFSRHAQDPDIQIRSGVADVLGFAGDPTALAILEPMRRDQDQQVALAAERAAARLRN